MLYLKFSATLFVYLGIEISLLSLTITYCNLDGRTGVLYQYGRTRQDIGEKIDINS